MPQKVLQQYSPRLNDFTGVQYTSFAPGGLATSASLVGPRSIEITANNEYQYLEGGVAGAIFGATSINSMFPSDSLSEIDVSAYRQLRGKSDWTNLYIELDFLGTDTSDQTKQCSIGLTTMSASDGLTATDTVYWYYDELPSHKFRTMLLAVHNPAIRPSPLPPGYVVPDDDIKAHLYVNITFNPLDLQLWTVGVSAAFKVPTDETAIDDGDWNNGSDTIPIPGFPAVDALTSGIVRAYKMDNATLNAFAQELWNPNFIETIEQFFNNPSEAIINLGVIPFTPSLGNTVNIQVGNYTATARAQQIVSQWYSLNCGSFKLSEYYGSYLDYNSDVSIYLPYIGSRSLNAADVMGSHLTLVYHIDVLSGAVVAMLQCAKSTKRGHKIDAVLYSWQGHCMSTVPLSATNASEKAIGLASAAVSIATGAATTAASGGAGAAIGAGIITSGLSAATSSGQTHYDRCGGITGDAGIMGVQQAYITITRPRMTMPSKYFTVRGGATYASGDFGLTNLSGFSGMTVCEKILVDGLNATQEERDEIQRLAREGIIL